MQNEIQVTTDITGQLNRLVELGLPSLAGYSDADFMALGTPLANSEHGLLVIHPSVASASRLAPLLRRDGKQGFVVTDMTDLDEFGPIEGVTIPDDPLYVISNIDRGDDMRNWTPEEALTEITSRGRRPLTINEGISWLLQQPDVLEPNKCFMTIASRKRKGNGLDARTPAIWISNGTGRDGTASRGAPKVGWCWARNRHTWLGIASTADLTQTIRP